MTTAVNIPCRAKDPNTCPYHGAQLRAEKALIEGDQAAYLDAQVELMAAIKTTPEVAEFFNTDLDQRLEERLLTENAEKIVNEWSSKTKMVVGSWRVLRYQPAPDGEKRYNMDVFVTRVGHATSPNFYRIRVKEYPYGARYRMVPPEGVTRMLQTHGGRYPKFEEFPYEN